MSIRSFILTTLLSFSLYSAGQNNGKLTHFWGDIEHKGTPWVTNMSRPHEISKGLEGRHLSLWASHGHYYDLDKGVWKWQRPFLFCTTEDLYTQTIVIPYLIPMLENAGAVVFTPRERDWQRNEVIVDNDDMTAVSTYYREYNGSQRWGKTADNGFAQHGGVYQDQENPFIAGTARESKTTKKKDISYILYQPHIPEQGKYAVYVSYQSLPKSVDDAQYIVYHQGQSTEFRVNQQMGGGTWVYLGTFEFDKGCNEYNCVMLTNYSSHKGVVTADAVRFGGGMGNIVRGGYTSGMPRTLEGARYYAQWAGAPYEVYSSKDGTNDYADDINVRSLMTNWLTGGSVYVPDSTGKNVPIELSLAIHSDAGYAKDGKSLTGSLAICTTDYKDGKLGAGVSRDVSKTLASALLDNATKDIIAKYGQWNRRYLWDRNYSETRLPEVPSAILETLSHQNFPDMRMGQDPNFRFTLARSIYKTLLRYISTAHGESYIAEPLQPKNFYIKFHSNNKVTLSWTAQTDPQEPSAKPTSYNVYMATGSSGFDNGTNVKGNSYTVKLEPHVQYNFKITACNAGGESFPTETLSAVYVPDARETVLVVNGFHRLSAPAIIENDSLQGFDLDRDAGVSYGLTAGWSGRQQCFDKAQMGIEGPGGLGYSGNEYAGHFIAGNDFNYTVTHTEAIASTNRYHIVSCSSDALLNGKVRLKDYACVDLILGLEKYSPYTLEFYKTFTAQMRQLLTDYARNGGSLIVSGSYIGSDMQAEDEKAFLQNTLKLRYSPTEQRQISGTINGLGMSFDIYHTLNHRHYAATAPEVLEPVGTAICAMQYEDGTSAAVAYQGTDCRLFVMGFPFECIQSKEQQKRLMQGILNYVVPSTIN